MLIITVYGESGEDSDDKVRRCDRRSRDAGSPGHYRYAESCHCRDTAHEPRLMEADDAAAWTLPPGVPAGRRRAAGCRWVRLTGRGLPVVGAHIGHRNARTQSITAAARPSGWMSGVDPVRTWSALHLPCVYGPSTPGVTKVCLVLRRKSLRTESRYGKPYSGGLLNPKRLDSFNTKQSSSDSSPSSPPARA